MQQQLIQAQIEETEAQYQSPRTKREKRYYTPLGEIIVQRRAYITPDGIKVKVDEELGLPKDKWLPMVLELACALGVSSEFPNSHKLFQRWTQISLTEKTLANQVEHTGNVLQTKEFDCQCEPGTCSQPQPINSDSSKPDLLYVGVDGVMTPLNQKPGYKEAKVGVIFWGQDHQKLNKKRGLIRQKEYVATLKSRNEFRTRMAQMYRQLVARKNINTVVIGDGAHWIWDMADEISQEIEAIRASAALAPPACGIVRFRAKGQGGAYWYYKWQSPQPIFVTKKGNSSRYKYIGKAGSEAFLEAVEMMKNRTKISALEQILHTLELGRLDLVEEASRINERS